MREILFKAKRKDNNEWVEGCIWTMLDNSDGPITKKYFIRDKNYSVYGSYSWKDYEVIQETIAQYTGLTDKNGVKIFENDILKCHYVNVVKDIHIEQVVFYKGKFMAYGKLNGAEHWASLYDGISRLVIDKSVYMDEMEVIGNTFDNKEFDEEVK